MWYYIVHDDIYFNRVLTQKVFELFGHQIALEAILSVT